MKLRYKFFLAFLSTSFLIIFFIVGIMQIFVYRNFADFVNNTELEKLSSFKTALAEEYSIRNNWNKFKRNPGLFIRIMNEKVENTSQPPPAPFHAPVQGPKPNSRIRRLERRRLLHPPPPADPHYVGSRLVLFNKKKEFVAGPFKPGDSFTFSKIEINNKVIGWLGLKIMKGMHHPLEKNFLKAQKSAFFVIGAGIFLMTILISYILSRHLLSPVNELMKGTKEMSSFNFDTEISVKSRDELGLLAENFNNMASTLKNYEEIRKNWISDISHELRTPISILKGKIEALQDGIRKMTPDTLDSLHSDITRLQKLVEDLHILSLADSESIHIKKTKIWPIRILISILDTFQVRLEEKKIEIITDFSDTIDINIFGSKPHMERLFSNLIENSIRYTDSPGSIIIKCRTNPSCFKLIFEDSKPGVSDESLPLIFNRLYRDDKSRSRALGGSGLGLSICRQIVENHKGSIISAHSKQGGLKLIIELPLNKK